MDLMSDAPKMARDIAAIRIAYMLGVWSESDTQARLIDSAWGLGRTLRAAAKVMMPPPRTPFFL